MAIKYDGFKPFGPFSLGLGAAISLLASTNPATAPIAAQIGALVAGIVGGINFTDEEMDIKAKFDDAMNRTWNQISLDYGIFGDCLTELKQEVIGKETTTEAFISISRREKLEESLPILIKSILKKHQKKLDQDSPQTWDGDYIEIASKDIGFRLVNALNSVFDENDLIKIQKNIKDIENESFIVDDNAFNEFFRDEKKHDLIQGKIEANSLYDRLLTIFENDRKNHPSTKMTGLYSSLFPKGLPEILNDGRIAVEEKEAPKAIRDIIFDSWKREDQRHILLIGEGGIGKTVAMLTLPEEIWFKSFGIPVIYIPLQRLDIYEGDLNRYIKEKIGSDNYVRCIDLANRSFREHPNLLFLLDGFNEIPDKYKQKAEKYIREWMEKPGIQIITTSRLGFFLENRFLKYRLLPLSNDTVRSFLIDAGITEEQLPRQHDRIWDVINIPLMLTMYTQIEKVKEMAIPSSVASILEWKDPDNAAHIIWNFLQMELCRCIERDDSSLSALQYATAIFAVAPYICSQMSHLNKLYINVNFSKNGNAGN